MKNKLKCGKFIVLLDKNLAETWIEEVNRGNNTYKKTIHVSGGFMYFGCFPIKVTEIEDENNIVEVLISYDFASFPEVIHVGEISEILYP